MQRFVKNAGGYGRVLLLLFVLVCTLPSCQKKIEEGGMWRGGPEHKGSATGPEIRGELLWKTHLDGWLASSPSVSGGTVFIGESLSKTLYALDSKTGEKMWTYETKGAVAGTPLV